MTGNYEILEVEADQKIKKSSKIIDCILFCGLILSIIFIFGVGIALISLLNNKNESLTCEVIP